MTSDKTVNAGCRKLVVDAGVRMLDSGLTVATWGNISVCDRDAGLVYITPSGMNYHEIVEDDINVYNLDGELIEGHRRPSIELELHLGMFNARPEIGACIHTHPIFSTVFSSMGQDIPIDVHDEAAQALGDSVRCADYALPGTKELALNAQRAIGDKANACMLRSHGLVCIGADLDAAFKVSTVVEMVAEILWRIRATGGDYIPISGENVAAMQEFVKTKYGQY
ncbi:MAG: class II aldolase/adducin family protein [Atopobiaceae bacterium]|jgi:L-fuculose-phosphate aldolase|nr:class II aldolase/adducin family protein [Atopobiaceae bacterium]MCI2172627.1 class II aldolase/adducin family protein [Atopobiaceae bacterium]MCI2206934.1 class II aldolase/adducin family protein [Atopobiaceae bacterium]